MTEKKNFLNYINVFRGLAILLIIMGHSMQFGQGLALRIVQEVFCGGTALFIFISGFLFEHLSYKFEYKNYLSKKWTNVILPYFITAIPGIFFCFYYPFEYKNTFWGMNKFLQIGAFLSVGRVHNTPTWFIPMIVLFFIFSIILLKLEKRGILFKLLPLLFIVTIFCQRGEVEYENLISLSFGAKYLAYVKYIITGFVHFFSLYVFGMYCSSNKSVIDKFYEKRILLFVLMLILSALDVILAQNGIYCNFTISKTFLTMVLVGYLKHYDEFIMNNKPLNSTLDFIAKYSFGLFFVHWYILFLYNKFFHIKGVYPVSEGILKAFGVVSLRFAAVCLLSFLILFVFKKILEKMKLNTRMFLGI